MIERLIHGTYEPIVSYRGSIGGRYYVSNMFETLPETVTDKTSLELAQVKDLHRAVDSTQTRVGSATLFRSLVQPPTSLELILAKQDALRELESDDRLRNAFEEYMGQIKEGEEDLFGFLNGEVHAEDPYGDFKRARKAGVNIRKAAENIPKPESEYLSILVDDIKDFGNTETYRLMRGPIYRTFRGIKSKETRYLLEPRLKFRSGRVTLANLTPPALIALALIYRDETRPYLEALPEDYRNLAFLSLPTLTMMGLMHGTFLKPQMDYLTVIDPLKQKTLADFKFARAVDAVGGLDEMLSFAKFDETMPHETVIPEVTDENAHYFEAENLRNPMQARGNHLYVPNDVNLNGSRLTFITGPNSGGKTTYCKSVVQNQLLGQIGSRVVASRARMNMADKIAYQAPHFDSLQDEEGRFGTELKRTRDIFYSTTPKSLVVLDELSEGTTIEEKLRTSQNILNGFHSIGNNTILVTHNHELVDNYREDGKGQFLQVEFNGDRPTHRLVEGVSRVSHADKVAKKIGLSEEDIQRHLEERGYR